LTDALTVAGPTSALRAGPWGQFASLCSSPSGSGPTAFFEPEPLRRILFVGIIAMSGACYAFSPSQEIGNRSVRTTEDNIIGASQRSAFLAYVERRQMRSAALVEGVSVGDVLPQEGVTYYNIPLYFGAGLHRCAVIAGKAAIVDPRTGRVVEVIE
jgi:hypothetical protein